MASHAFVDQEEIRTGNGFVVKLRLAAGISKSLQCYAKFLQRLKHRKFAQIGKRQSDVIGVMERVSWNRVALKTVDEFFVARGITLTSLLKSAGSCPHPHEDCHSDRSFQLRKGMEGGVESLT
jgi:hypothetical protein